MIMMNSLFPVYIALTISLLQVWTGCDVQGLIQTTNHVQWPTRDLVNILACCLSGEMGFVLCQGPQDSLYKTSEQLKTTLKL